MPNKHIAVVAAVLFGTLCALLMAVAAFIAAAHDTLVDPPLEFGGYCAQCTGVGMLALACGAIIFFGSILVIKAADNGLQ